MENSLSVTVDEADKANMEAVGEGKGSVESHQPSIHIIALHACTTTVAYICIIHLQCHRVRVKRADASSC